VIQAQVAELQDALAALESRVKAAEAEKSKLKKENKDLRKADADKEKEMAELKSSLKALDDNQTILVSKDMKSPAGALTGKARKRRSKMEKPEEEALTAVINEKTAKSASAFSFSGGLLALWIAICLASFFLGSWLPQRISI
jgi:chromosome segregation ATPase